MDNANENSQIFTRIYDQNLWGGRKGKYYSGSGSHHAHVRGYAKTIAGFIAANDIQSVVEIGCGDFNVSSQILALAARAGHAIDYTGYDVVEGLIERNQREFSGPSVRFFCADACTAAIAAGDLLIIRQVLQHLSNASILQIVRKFGNYRYVIVSEHQPASFYGTQVIPNLDKETGASIRGEKMSGVYLDQPPFNCQVRETIYSMREYIAGLHAAINTFVVVPGGT